MANSNDLLGKILDIDKILKKAEEYIYSPDLNPEDEMFVINDPKGGFYNLNSVGLSDHCDGDTDTQDKAEEDCCDDSCRCGDKEEGEKKEPRFFNDISVEVKHYDEKSHKSKTYQVSNATFQESFRKKKGGTIFTAEVEDEGKVFIYDPDYDPDLSHVGNAKKFVNEYLKDNPSFVAIVDELVKKENKNCYSAKIDDVDEASDIIVSLRENFFISAVISIPADKTFEVLSLLDEKSSDIHYGTFYDVYPAGDRNIIKILV